MMNEQQEHTMIRDYDTDVVLDGLATAALVDASMAIDDGAVSAMRVGDTWEYVPAQDVEHYRRDLGCDVRTVYVER